MGNEQKTEEMELQDYLAMCFLGFSLQLKHDILFWKRIILQLEFNLV